MTTNGEILKTLIEVRTQLTDMKDRLYDKDGDIPAIREHLNTLNGRVFKNRVIAVTALVIATLGSGTAGITKLLEIW